MGITMEDVKIFCKNIGLKVLSEEYIGIDNKMSFEDNEGYRYYTTFHIIKTHGKPSKMFNNTNIYKIYNIKNYIKIKGLKCRLLSDSYIDDKRRLEFQCECGEKYICNINTFINQQQYTCKICSTGALSDKELNELLNRKQLILLNPISSKSEDMFIQDKEGYKYKTKFIYVKGDSVLHKFHTSNPYTICNIRNYLKLNDAPCELLSDEYSGQDVELIFRCDCGNIFNRRLDSLIYNKSYVCKDCGHVIAKNKMKHSIEYIYNICLSHNLKPLFSEYNNKNDKLLCETNEGYKVVPIASNLINGSGYSVFEKSNPYTIYNIKLWLKINNMSCKLLSKEYLNSTTSLIFKCKDCGKEYKCSWARMYNGKIERCKKCSKKQSSLECKTEDLLQSNNIQYIKEYKFEDCKYKLPLPFDFAIFNDNKIICLIECDGGQHYKAIDLFGGEKSFKITKIRDNIKNKYCKDNNIKLIRIPYWEFDNGDYIQTINNTCLL